MDDFKHHRHHVVLDYCLAVSAVIIALCIAVFVIWTMTATTSAKAFDADGVVCFTHAFSTECHETRAKAQ